MNFGVANWLRIDLLNTKQLSLGEVQQLNFLHVASKFKIDLPLDLSRQIDDLYRVGIFQGKSHLIISNHHYLLHRFKVLIPVKELVHWINMGDDGFSGCRVIEGD